MESKVAIGPRAPRLPLLHVISIAALASLSHAQQLQWTASPEAGHWYAETGTSLTWDEAESQAIAAGGHLAAIGSPEENAWLFDTFGASPRFHWIGLNDVATEGTFTWSNGEPVVFTNWASGEPNNENNGEDHVVLDSTIPYLWNDIVNTSLGELAAIIEIESGDCDQDGVPDVYQIILDGSIDSNSNGVLDWCEPSAVGLALCFGNGSDGVACPCQNDTALGVLGGCTNSLGLGARLGATGSSVFAADDLVLHVSAARPHQPAVVIQGSMAISIPFKDGKLCMGFPTDRLEVLSLDGAGAASTSGSIATQGSVASSGTTTFYQVWYRDPQLSPCGTGSNLTHGLQIDWI